MVNSSVHVRLSDELPANDEIKVPHNSHYKKGGEFFN